MDKIEAAAGFEPTHWFLCFSRDVDFWWVRLLAIGKYRHVRAFGMIPGARIWVFCDVTLCGGLCFKAAPEGREADELIGAWMAGCDLLHMRRGEGRGLGRWPVLSCVVALRNLIGVSSGALRPDRLWRDCLAQGAEIVADETKRADTNAGTRPDAAGDQEARDEGGHPGAAVSARA